MRGLTSGIFFSANTRGSQILEGKKVRGEAHTQRVLVVISASIITGVQFRSCLVRISQYYFPLVFCE